MFPVECYNDNEEYNKEQTVGTYLNHINSTLMPQVQHGALHTKPGLHVYFDMEHERTILKQYKRGGIKHKMFLIEYSEL